MTSMRRLHRRLARWQRYARRYRPGRSPRNHNVVRCDIRDPRGFLRADTAVRDERERRQLYHEYGWRPVVTVDTGGLL